MQVQLSPQQNFFFLTDPVTDKTYLSLTYEKPGPAPLNYQTLPAALQEIVTTARLAKIIEITEEEIEEVVPEPLSPAENYLHQSVKECLRSIQMLAQQHRLDVLTTMQELEQKGQNKSRQPRKMVLAAITEALQQGEYNEAVIDSELEEVTITFDTPAGG